MPLTRKTPLKAKTALKRTGFKQTGKKPSLKRKSPKKVVKRLKLPSTKTVRNRCDKLLTPIIKVMQPNCLLCGGETQVAHHHIKKSTSNSCRYYIPNLIGLCHKCHSTLHHDELLWCGRVVRIMGLAWLDDLEAKKRENSKCDVHWYLNHEARLRDILRELNQ